MALHPVVRQVSNFLHSGNVVEAEHALVAVAEAEGDHALVAVIEEMPEEDLIAVLREYDDSHDTIIASLLTPEKFASVIGLDLRYREADSRIQGMISAVVMRDPDLADDYLAAMGATEGGILALRDYFIDRHAELECLAVHARIDMHDVARDDMRPEKMADLAVLAQEIDEFPESTRPEHSDRGWMEIAWLLRFHHKDIFIDVLRLLRKKMTDRDLEMDHDKAEAEPAAKTEDDDEEESAL